MTRLRSFEMLQKLPSARKVLTRTLFALFTLTFLLVFIPWQQFAIGDGKVIAFSPTERPYIVNAPIHGRIKKWFVNEGDKVTKGQSIVEIVDNDPELIKRLLSEKDAILQRIKSSEAAVTASLSNVVRQKKLFEEGINSKRQYELANIELSNYENELAKAKVELVDVEVRIARQNTQLVQASGPGVVFRRLSGQESVVVSSGEKLAEIIPDTASRAVTLYISGNDIPFVRIHQKARLQFEGWPAIQFRGWPDLAIGTFGGEVSFIDAADDGNGMFRVVITPTERWPNPEYLRQGVRVHGWILFGEVPLWYEIWRQFNGFPPEPARDSE